MGGRCRVNIDSVSELLKQADLGFKTFGELEDLAEVEKLPHTALPGCFVVADAESGAPVVEGSYILDQVINATVAIMIVTRSEVVRKGPARQRLVDLAKAVRSELFGKQPEGWDSVLTFAGAVTVRPTPGLMGRIVRMRGRFHIRTTHTPN